MGIIDELKATFNMNESRRRSHVGMDVAFWEAGGLGTISAFSPDAILGNSELTRKQRYEMLRRSKMLLSMRCADDDVAKLLERRKEWNIARLPTIKNNLECVGKRYI